MTPEKQQQVIEKAKELYNAVEYGPTWNMFASAYLAGFTASHDLDARIREEHELMYQALKTVIEEEHLGDNSRLGDYINSLIQKIETK